MSSAPLDEFTNLRLRSGLSPEEAAAELDVSAKTVRRWETGETPLPRMALISMQGLARKRKLAGGSKQEAEPDFTFIDLFAGIGGFRKGFESIGGKCVFTSEWDEHSKKTYLANFDCDHEVAGDITKIEADQIPAHDVLLAGFPCQPFSIAGVSKKNALGRKHGFLDETQGTLFFDIARIIAHHQPAAFVLENVKNLASHDKGKTFKVIMKTLKEDLGYHVQERIIDAKSFVPQHRERIFIVGFRDPTAFNFEALKIPARDKGPKMKTILHPEDGTEEIEAPFVEGNIGRVNKKYTLSDKLWNYLKNYAAKHKAKGNGFGFGICGPDDVARTLSARYYKDGSEILIKQKGKNPRRLTPRECARLMGFDEPGGEKMVIPVSDTQAYRQFGNAVVVAVVKAVAKGMKPHIMEALAEKAPRRKKAAHG